jgi:hypothetical protein
MDERDTAVCALRPDKHELALASRACPCAMHGLRPRTMAGISGPLALVTTSGLPEHGCRGWSGRSCGWWLAHRQLGKLEGEGR